MRVMGEISRVRDALVHESHLETRVSHLKIAPENHTPGHLVRAALYTCKMYKVIAVWCAVYSYISLYTIQRLQHPSGVDARLMHDHQGVSLQPHCTNNRPSVAVYLLKR